MLPRLLIIIQRVLFVVRFLVRKSDKQTQWKEKSKQIKISFAIYVQMHILLRGIIRDLFISLSN